VPVKRQGYKWRVDVLYFVSDKHTDTDRQTKRHNNKEMKKRKKNDKERRQANKMMFIF
jgi:DNA-binding winged helix-turn-helix (wHTH) protein